MPSTVRIDVMWLCACKISIAGWLCVQLYCYRGDNWLVHTCYVIFICRFFIFRLVFSLPFSCPLPSQLIKFLFLESLACQKHYSISILLSHVLSLHFVVFPSFQTTFYAVTFLFPGFPEKHCLSPCTSKLTWISIRWTFDFFFPLCQRCHFHFCSFAP